MKKKVNILSVVFYLFLFFIASLSPREACPADQGPFQAFAEGKSFEAENLCRTAQIRDNERSQYQQGTGSPIIAAIDGDLNTYVTKKCAPDQWIEIQFEGARKWVNFIGIQYTGKDDFKFEIFNFKGEIHDINVLSTNLKDGSESRHIRIIEFEPVQAKGIRWSWVGAGSPNETTNIYKISAWFYQPDPDLNDPLNWLLCETSLEMGVQDIDPLWSKITSLTDWCPDTTHYCHFVKPSYDKAGDFINEAIGGGENSHDFWTGMDYHDLSVIAQHGGPCRILFTSGPFPLNKRLNAPIDIYHCWGDRDAEWFCALSCSPYKGLCKWAWATAFDGLHLQCGFTTPAYETNGKFLGGFAGYMISSNDDDPALPISQSWFLAKNRFMSPVTKDTICAIVLADDWRAFNDHLWGQGPVSEDPSLENGRLRGMVWAILNSGISSSGENSINTEHLPQLTQEQSKLSSPLESPYIIIPTRTPKGIPVKIPADMGYPPSPSHATRYIIHAIAVNHNEMVNWSSDLCYWPGDTILCHASIGQDAEGNWWSTEDEYALIGNPQHGIVQFVNIDEYVTPKHTPPDVPTTDWAEPNTNILFMTLNLLPEPNSYSIGYSYNLQEVYDLDLGQTVPDSSFDLSLNVEYQRMVDTFALVGPGACMSATWGGGEYPHFKLQQFTKGGWHTLTTDKTAVDSVISDSAAIELLTTIGEEATIGGIPAACDTLLILSSRFTYYETNGEYETDRLEPIYDFLCVAQSQQCGDETLHVYVPIRVDILRGAIDNPPDGSRFNSWDTVTFIGHATGGTPPDTFKWYSSVEGYLGTGDTIRTDSLSVVVMGTQWVPHTITLTVTDSLGKTSNASISVLIAGHGDANGDWVIDVGDVVYLINYLFKNGPPPNPLVAGDVNCDGIIDVGDIVNLITYLFKNGQPPGC